MKNTMNRHMKQAIASVMLSAVLLTDCCGALPGMTAASAEAAGSAAAVQTISAEGLFSDRDMKQEVEAADAVLVQLDGSTAVCASDAVRIDGSRITLLHEGVYVFSGTLDDGQIIVDADSTDKVQIVLSGTNITSASSAAIYCLQADKVFLTLAAGSENALSNGGTFTQIDDNEIDAVVYAKTDLTLNGTGSLTVNSPAGHGVVSKDELTITGGTFIVNATGHGFAGKDSVAVADGCLVIVSGKDGIHAEHEEDAAKGFIYIAGGSLTIDAHGDALSASGDLQIDGGCFELTTGGGSAAMVASTGNSNAVVAASAGDSATALLVSTGRLASGNRGSSVPRKSSTQASAASDTESCKGIKAGGALTVNGGTFVLDTADDAVHAGGNVTITGGEWVICTGDDAIHADAAVVIQAGNFSIPTCYEGVEGQSVTIGGGTLDITASDDGINAAGGNDGSGTGFGFGRQDQFAADGSCVILINGGMITIVSDGDSIDSNGSLTVNGGTLKLTCNGNGNTAIDTNGAFTHNGGSITTNDGSESGSSMGRGRGAMSGAKSSGRKK